MNRKQKKPIGYLGRPKRPKWIEPGKGPIGAPFDDTQPQVMPPPPLPPTPDLPADAGVGDGGGEKDKGGIGGSALAALGRDYNIDFAKHRAEDH